MNLPSEDIKDMLVTEASLGLTFAQNLFIGMEPSSPRNIVTIYDTPGAGPDSNLAKEEDIWHPAIQIKVRNVSYVAAGDLITQIKDALHNRTGETWNGATYILIQCAQEPFCLGFDENNLALWVMNLDIMRQ